MAEYIHKRQQKGVPIQDEDDQIYESLIVYKSKVLVVVQDKTPQGINKVIVPGFVKGLKRRGPDGTEISEVVKVEDNLKPEIKEILKNRKFKGFIDFW